MSTTLPPLPEPFINLTPGAKLAWGAQMQAYATESRADLEAENKRLREELENLRKEALEPSINQSHRCVKCLHAYSPEDDQSEDCPACGHDGSTVKDTK